MPFYCLLYCNCHVRGYTVYDRDRSYVNVKRISWSLVQGRRIVFVRSSRKIFREGEIWSSFVLRGAATTARQDFMFTNFSKPGNDAPNTPAQASARRFSDFHNARHPRVVTTVARTTRSICALGLPCGLAARGCCVRLEGRPPRIRAYSAARKTAYQTCRTHRSRDLEACVACSSLPPSLSLSFSLQGTKTGTE